MPVQSFEVGAVLRASVSVYRQNASLLVPLFLLTSVPVLALTALGPLASVPPPPTPLDAADPADVFAWSREFWAANIWVALADGFCALWMQAAFGYAVVRSMRSRAPRLLEAVWESVRALPYALVAGVLAAFLIGIGFALFILPGVVFLLMFAVVVPAAAVERRLGSALARSHQLTRGHKWSILGLLLLLFLFGLAFVFVVAQIAAEGPAGVARFIVALVDAALSSFVATVLAVVYHDLRVLKDGADPGTVARVFE